MKKKMSIAALLLVFVMLLSACGAPAADNSATPSNTGGQTQNDQPNGSGTTMEPKTLTFATQSVGGGSYVRAAAFCEVVNEYMPEGWSIELSPIGSGAVACTLLVEQGTCDVGSGMNFTNKLLAAGEYEGAEAMVDTLAICGGTDYAYMTVIFSEDFQKRTGYTTLEEVVASGQAFNVSTKAPGSSGMQAAETLLSCMDTSFEAIEALGGSCYHVDPTQMCDLLKEGQVDVLIDCAALSQPALSELTMTTSVYFAELTDETLAKLEAEHGYPTITLPAGSWNGQAQDLKTGSSCEVIVVRSNVPDEVVYAITKGMCEGKDKLVELIPTCANFDPATAGDERITGLKLHPGAEQYYKEAGYLN